MKIRLLENIRMAGVSGTRGEIVDVDESLALSLEQHGQASFVDAPDDSNAADDSGADADEAPENEAKPGERKSRRKGKAKE